MTGERCIFDVRLLDTRGCETRLSESGGFFIWCVFWRVVVASNAVNRCSFCVVVLGAVLRVYDSCRKEANASRFALQSHPTDLTKFYRLANSAMLLSSSMASGDLPSARAMRPHPVRHVRGTCFTTERLRCSAP
jgi:hypothetical protein